MAEQPEAGEAVLAMQQAMAQELGAVVARYREPLVALIRADDPEVGDDEIGADVITALIEVAMTEMVGWIGPDEYPSAVYAMAVGQIATVAAMIALAQQQADREKQASEPQATRQ